MTKSIQSPCRPVGPFQRILKGLLRPLAHFVRGPYQSKLKSLMQLSQGLFYAKHWDVLCDVTEPKLQLARALEDLMIRDIVPPTEKGLPDLNSLKQVAAGELREMVRSEAGYSKIAVLCAKAQRLAMMDVKDVAAFQAYISIMKIVNKEAIGMFRAHSTPHLILHVSCVSRLSRGVASSESFIAAERSGISQVIITGDPERRSFSYNPDTKQLIVPTPDVYEHLPAKVMSAMFFFALCGVTDSLLKLDDDHRLADLKKLKDGFNMSGALRRPAQLGKVQNTRWLGNMNRVWHFGKCRDIVKGNTPYSFPGTIRWVTGAGGYFVNKEALRLLLWSYIYFPDYIATGLYEDVIVSDLLERQGADLCNYDMNSSLSVVDEY